MTRPILMIPGPIEISPAVQDAFSSAPPSHVSPACIEAFGNSLKAMREVWKSESDSQPFIISGSGTLAMEMSVVNLVEPGDVVVVVNSGYFSDRVAMMLERRGATVHQVRAEPGDVPAIPAVGQLLRDLRPTVMFATHVDTSTGARVDAAALADLCRDLGILSVFDGVCATAGEEFDMSGIGADIYLTASQKAIGLPPGLALLVASGRAMERRNELKHLPPLGLDFHSWLPIMKAYEEARPSYFATPATNLIMALEAGLQEILAGGIDTQVAKHAQVASALRKAWASLGLALVAGQNSANTLSAIYYPAALDSSLVKAIHGHGVIVAGGLHPLNKDRYFRVGHMGYTITRPDWLIRTVQAVAAALLELGHDCDSSEAIRILEHELNL